MKREVTIAREAAVSMAGLVFGQAVRFGYNLAAARLLGVDALGVYALVVAVQQVAEVVAIGGYDLGLLRFVNQRQGEARRQTIASAIKRTSLAALFAGLLIALFSGQLASLLHGGELLRMTLLAVAVALPLSVTTSMAGFAIQAHQRLMPKMVATQIIMPGLFLFSMLVARQLWGREAALALPFVIAPLAAMAWILPGFRRMTGVELNDVLRAGSNRELNRFALPLLAVAFFSILSHWIDVVMLGLLTDVGTVGLYQPAARTAGLLRSVLLAFSGIAAPMIAACHGRQDYGGVRATYEMVTRWTLTLVMVPFLLLVLFPGEALSVFGKGFAGGAVAMAMLSVSSLLLAWFGLGSTVLAMSGGERLSMMNQAGALVLQAVLHWLLIPRFGLNGAALSTLIVMALLTLARMAELRHLLGIPYLSAALWKPTAAGVVAGGVMLGVRYAAPPMPPLALLAVAGAAGLALYALLIRAFRLEPEETEVIFKLFPFLKRNRSNEAP
ncbi:flippase [Chlorobaculum sp. 24CR]|uniref:oligosaccharide flippase family protein n=1 Tax=Chlorobaculum sp. 24CR TaxID=2508878 RepID=UPI00100ABBB9|nr:polysaccharide biosynthesis C-terminal domain-containing protein [Chlorobaculum sp. 24CR]RXK88793.1 flippase [Chlorobaculum sp. 24CR]